MVCKIKCVAILGVDALPVIVETDVCNGLPGFDMVGLLSSDIKESRERVRTAIKNSGFMIPPKRITINFSPGNIRKTGTYFDLPIAVSILQVLGVIQCNISDKMFVGELSLNGDVVRVNGVLSIVLCAASQGIQQCFVPVDNLGECSFVEGIQVIGVENLNQLVMILSGVMKYTNDIEVEEKKPVFEYNFKDIKGQIQARRGAEIAAAGMHNMLMIGPPGTGKSVIAKCMPSILPDMQLEEKIEISRIQSIAGNLNGKLVSTRPFRSPHHTATVSAMIGRGANPKPGEITLAHGGVLYMDEFPEFSRSVMETLRQPLEDRKIVVSRAGGSFVFPASCILMASMNPCQCGYYPDRNKCNCTEHEVKKYLEKISGPILDRMDLCIHLNPIAFGELSEDIVQETSEEIKKRVNKAVDIQRERYKNTSINFNSELEGKNISKYCFLEKKERDLMGQIFNQFDLSIRAYEKIIKVARTIADLREKEKISTIEIAEAVTYRPAKWMK